MTRDVIGLVCFGYLSDGWSGSRGSSLTVRRRVAMPMMMTMNDSPAQMAAPERRAIWSMLPASSCGRTPKNTMKPTSAAAIAERIKIDFTDVGFDVLAMF